MLRHFSTMVLAAAVAALPVQANQGGGGKGGGVSERLWEQQQQLRDEQQQQQESEQIPEAAAPAATAPTDPASVAAGDFYRSIVAGIDSAIDAKRQAIAELEKDIAALDHQIARDFAAERAGDRTTDEMKQSAEKALESRGTKQAQQVAAAGYLDPGASDATIMVCLFEASVEELKALEAARADMAGAARAYGATIE